MTLQYRTLTPVIGQPDRKFDKFVLIANEGFTYFFTTVAPEFHLKGGGCCKDYGLG